jgi:NADH-quinone oxidoreductase subunit G
VSCEGRVQRFNGAVKPRGDTRPAWKVLRVLGSLLGLPGFELESLEDVRRQLLPADDEIRAKLGNGTAAAIAAPAGAGKGFERVADVPIHFADPLVRRSPPLQKTSQARAPTARMNARTMQSLGLAAGQPVLANGAKLGATLDAGVPDGCVRIAAAHASTAGVGPMFGAVKLERLDVERAA